jgi:hypothetical protein
MTENQAPIGVDLGGPVTATQRLLWLLGRRTVTPAALNLSYALAIDGPVDTVALQAAFRALVAGHETLRTTFHERDGEPVAATVGLESALSQVDLTPQDTTEADAVRLIRLDRARGFDLEREAPLRVALLRLAPRRHLLLLTLHHIAGDGWSLYLLRDRLSEHYATAAGGGVSPSDLPRPALDCAAVARAQQEWLRGPGAEQEVRWWVDRLRYAQAWPRELGPRPADPEPLHRQVTLLPAELTAQLTSLSKQTRVSLFATLLTGFAVLLQRWTGCADTAIGTLVANRPNAGSARVMGAHYNAVLINTDLSGDPSLAQCLLDVSARTVAALDHQSLPLPVVTERLARECGWDAERTPGFMFLMDRYPMEGLRLAGCQVTGVYVDRGDGPVERLRAEVCADVIFFVREAGERLTLSVFYRPGLLPAPRVTQLMRTYQEILAVACESPETPLRELPGLGSGSEPAPYPDTEPSGVPTLRRVTDLAPVDALSPVAGRT